MANESKNGYTLALILITIGLFSYFAGNMGIHIIDSIDTEAISNEKADFYTVLLTFTLCYGMGALLDFMCRHLVALFPVKRLKLTRNIIISCYLAIAVHLGGAISYMSVWFNIDNGIFSIAPNFHYEALIGLSLIQALLFLTYWIDERVGISDSITIFNSSILDSLGLVRSGREVD
jgi:hypothetical protein